MEDRELYNMKRKTTRFLWFSLAGILAACVGVLLWLTVYMLHRSDEAISDVGNIYMSEVSIQLQRHFDSVVDLRMSQVEGIVERVPPETVSYGPEMLEELVACAEVRGFSYLGLYSRDGEFDVVCGEPVRIVEEEQFLGSLNRDEKKVEAGVTESGELMLLLGVSTTYPMAEGKTCTALVAGIPMSYINESLALDVDDTLIYSHIIQKDGTYVVRNSTDDQGSYFQRIEDVAQPVDGTAQEMTAEMAQAMAAGEDYSRIVTVDGEHRHVYCTPLPDSEWYLVSVMPYGTLDATISVLGNQRIAATLAGFGVILAVLLVVFFLYFKMTQKQLNQLEEARKEAVHANLAKSEFLSNMSHDIRTPMNAIVGMTAIAASHMDNQEQVRDCLKKISLSSRHLLGLINDVLDMSKIESGKLTLNMEPMSLRETMESMVNIIQPQIKSKSQYFDICIQDIQEEDVYCDCVRLNQVLLNLLSNAIKFTPEEGSIQVSLYQEASPRGDEFVRTHFLVRDTGIGMSPEFQKHIFDSFVREDSSRVQKIEGTGLGMAITKYIVDEMKGTISVASQKDEGSEFHVTLDLERCRLQAEDMVLPAWEMLVVDDDEQLCRSAASSLEEIGGRAEWALDGARAVEMAEARHQKGRDYHVVLLDWKMPGMSGLETARRIRALLGDAVPILLITAYDWSEIEEEAKSAGVSGFLPKPLFKSTLYHGLSRYASAEVPQEEAVQEQAVDYTGKRILLAEDNDLNWEIANELLSAFGFELERAENGKECVEKLEGSVPGTFDAILMDIRMPVMTGYEAAKAIRALNRPDADIPIIAMTADAFAEDIQRCMESGMNAHIAKPIDMRELVRVLQKYMKSC